MSDKTLRFWTHPRHRATKRSNAATSVCGVEQIGVTRLLHTSSGKYKNTYNIPALDRWYLKRFNCLEAVNEQVTCSFMLFKFRDFPWLFHDLFHFSMNQDIAVTFDNFQNSAKLFLFLFFVFVFVFFLTQISSTDKLWCPP